MTHWIEANAALLLLLVLLLLLLVLPWPRLFLTWRDSPDKFVVEDSDFYGVIGTGFLLLAVAGARSHNRRMARTPKIQGHPPRSGEGGWRPVEEIVLSPMDRAVDRVVLFPLGFLFSLIILAGFLALFERLSTGEWRWFGLF